MNLEAFYEKTLALLERFILLFVAWYKGRLDERAKVKVKAAEDVIDTYKTKQKVKDEIKKMSKQDLDALTVNDD